MTYNYANTAEVTREILSQVCRKNKGAEDLFLAIGKEVFAMSMTPINAKVKGRKAAARAVTAALKQQDQFKGLIRDALLGRTFPITDEDFRNIGQLAEFRAMGL